MTGMSTENRITGYAVGCNDFVVDMHYWPAVKSLLLSMGAEDQTRDTVDEGGFDGRFRTWREGRYQDDQAGSGTDGRGYCEDERPDVCATEKRGVAPGNAGDPGGNEANSE